MNVSSLPSLQSLRTQTSAQSSIVIANTQPITDLLGGTNVLSSSQVDSILTALDGNGLFAGTVDLSGQTPPAPPSAVGMARVLSLIAKTWTVTLDPSIFIFDDGSGGFWQLIVDTSGNVGTQSTVGPATSDIILNDGGGGFWKVAVDVTGLRYAISDPGPATIAPGMTDSGGNVWELVVDTFGNLGATLVYSVVSWSPDTYSAQWTDGGGPHTGNLAQFLATADYATVSSMSFLNPAVTSFIMNNAGTFPALTSLTFDNSNVTSIGITGMSLISLYAQNCPLLTTIDLDTSAATLFTTKLNNCNLNQAAVDGVLCSLDAGGNVGFPYEIYLASNVAPGPAGTICKNNLIAKGWLTVSTD